jgi:mannosyltransferase
MRDRHLIALAALIAIGAGLRFATLDLQSYWYDEAVTVGLMHRHLGGMLSEIARNESTPPLYYVVAWVWAKVFGTGEAGLRSLSALIGTASIPVFYAAARDLVSRRVGLAVAALTAVNPLLVWYSQEARAYALLALLSGLSLLYFARLARRARDTRTVVLWALFSALALLSHYFAAFLVGPMAVWLLWRRRERAVVAGVGAVVAVAAALLPLALHQQSLDLASFIRAAPIGYRIARAPKQFLVGFDAPLEVTLSIVAVAIAVAGLAFAARRLRDRVGVRLAAGLAGAGVAIPILLALVDLDYFDTRNLVMVWLPFTIAAAAGLVLGAPRIGAAGVALLAAIGVAAVIGIDVTANWQRDDWRGAARALGASRERRAIVITPASGALPFRLYRPDAVVMPPQGVPVQQVALVSRPKRASGRVHPPAPPRPANPGVPGFAPLRRDYAPTYSLVVVRAGGPLGITPAGIGNYRLLRDRPAAVLMQIPPAR